MSTPPVRRRDALIFAAALACPSAAVASSASVLGAKSRSALAELYASTPKARALGAKAVAVLVFPEILKAGAMIGGQTGEGVMLKGGNAIGFYRISAASYGLQLGAQKYGYALFFMTEEALAHLATSKGWSVGSGLSVAFIDDGFAKPINTTTLTQDVYAVAFRQRGLMAGSGLEGARIRQIYPEP